MNDVTCWLTSSQLHSDYYYITSVSYSAHTREVPGTVTQVVSDVDSC